MAAEQRPEFHNLEVQRSGYVATLVLRRPERKNALNPMLINELLWALDDLRGDASVRAIVLTGSGKAFCAGVDLRQISDPGEESQLAAKGDFAQLLLRFPKLQKPVIAKVNGAALGGGLGLVASCPFAIACESAKLGTPEILRGLFPMQIMAVLEPLIPRRKLLDMMLLGRVVSAATAEEWGLLTRVVPDAELDAAVDDLAKQLSERSPTAMRMGLDALATQTGKPLEEALPYLRGQLEELLGKEDALEGLTAFLQKRAPVWTGR